ncbi:MAG: DMT family transporter [Streptosporangiaceae bacterium]|nr:DMT family transporter [Streptosporangiaceae bacterium]
MSTPIAVVTALASALVLGISAVADQRSTKRVQARAALSPRIFADLVRQPLWLLAIAANIAGFGLQVVALSFGSLALVQPLLVFDLVFAVLINRSVGWQASTMGPEVKRWDPVMLAGVAAAVAGVAGFLVIGRPSAGTTDVSIDVLPPLAIGLIVVVGGCLAVAARSPNLRPLALALACGVNYGVAAFAVKLVTAEFGHGAAAVFTNWPIYVLAVAGPARLPVQPGCAAAGHVPGAGPVDHHLRRPRLLHRPRHPLAERGTAQRRRGDRRGGRVAAGDDHGHRADRRAFPPGRRGGRHGPRLQAGGFPVAKRRGASRACAAVKYVRMGIAA